jgi:hypothetical protein
MDKIRIEDAIIFGSVSFEKTDAKEHPLKTADCLTIPQAERLVKREKKWKSKDILHTNRCAYCQLNLRLFREELGVKPWWEEWNERWRKASSILVGLQSAMQGAARGNEIVTLPELFRVPAVLLKMSGDMVRTDVEITAIELSDRYLNLRVNLEELILTDDEMPLDITLVTHPGGEPLSVFTLPNLLERPEQSLKIVLPHNLADDWKGVESRGELPLRFILRPASGDLEID